MPDSTTTTGGDGGPLKVGYIREHFSAPLLQYHESDDNIQIHDDNKTRMFEVVECPGGSGELIGKLESGVVDIVIGLTDPLISRLLSRPPDDTLKYKIVGGYVDSPLNWAVITSPNTNDTKNKEYTKIEDLENSCMGISRVGSGSHTMAYVMGLQNGWDMSKMEFKVMNNIDGLIKGVNNGEISGFMWEWFTTKPYMDEGLVRFIGSVPTPWPSWIIAANHTHTSSSSSSLVPEFLDKLEEYIKGFDGTQRRDGSAAGYVCSKYFKGGGSSMEKDVGEWLDRVKYVGVVREVKVQVLRECAGLLEKAGFIVESKRRIEDCVDSRICTLI